MFDNSQLQQQPPTMYNPQFQQQSDMLDPQVQQQHQNIQMISAHVESSQSGFKMRNENDEDSNSNENMTVVVGAPPSNEDPQSKKQSIRKGRQRHTQHQIQQMKAFYQECSMYPDAVQRRMLAMNIGLTSKQIKFWFQKKRAKIKGEQEQGDSNYGALTRDNKHKIVELVVEAMEELIELAKPGSPFWISNYSFETLNVDEYMKAFPMGIGLKISGFRTEASRESMMVIMDHMNLIEILMDVNKWTTMFSGIVTRGRTLEVLSNGVAGSYDGYLQVMSAEFQIPSPLVPTRENYFVRYCTKQKEGSWAVVDVSLDYLQPSSTFRSRRRPSGCIIQELPKGYSKVTWIEHVEVDDKDVVMHNPYKLLENSLLAFGAKRWVASLERQCKHMASAMSINIPVENLHGIPSLGGRKSMLRLAERMTTYFCTSVGASKEYVWTPIDSADNGDDIKVMTRTSYDEPGRPCGIVLSVATSFWLPVSPKRVFDYLRDNTTRSQWDILSTGGIVLEKANIANDRESSHCVSLLHLDNENMNVGNQLILQASCIDLIDSYIIYSPIDVAVTNLVLSGGDPNYITLLPSGFAILPDGHGQCGLPMHDAVRSGGCMLTASFQILVDETPTTKISPTLVATIANFIKQSIRQIKVALS